MTFHPLIRLSRGSRALLLLCLAALGGCAGNGSAKGVSPGFQQYAGREVKKVELVGDVLLPEDSLRSVIITRPTECRILFIPFCIGSFGRDVYRLDVAALARDVVRLQLAYRDAGYYGTRVQPAVDPVQGGAGVRVRFAIEPGDRVTLRALDVSGTEGIIPSQEARDQLPLQVGGPFRRNAFLASADMVQAELLRRGYAYAQVLRNYSLDTIADVAQVQYEAVPGPLVTVDTVLFLGANRLGERTARGQLTFHKGDVLRAAELDRSQRNLYDLGLVSFASVQLAPDSLQRDPNEASATVVVRLVEAPQYLVEAAAGYGTLDCFRGQLRRVDRNFLGAARRLELSASLSKVGVGWPLDAGLDGSLCSALRRDGIRDSFSDTVNYQLQANFEQPRLFGTRNSVGLLLQTERVSEVNTFLRQSYGGQLSISRQLGAATLLNTTLTAERGRTEAEDVFFCVVQDVCTRQETAPLRSFRWSNALGAALVRNRVELAEGFPVGGYQLRGGVDWATEAIGSDDRYLRLVTEGSVFRQLAPGWVVGARLRGGTFLQGRIGDVSAYVPPERRFYAGGPSTVRGYTQNALGPGAYVARIDSAAIRESRRDTLGFIDHEGLARRSAIGGTQTVVASVELQLPSPLFSQYLRLATFVDAGQVWAPNTSFARRPIRVTPGAGVRIGTPIGPFRLDAAYRPYSLPSGPLYVFDASDPERKLILLKPDYQPPSGSGLLDRIQFQIAVGPAF